MKSKYYGQKSNHGNIYSRKKIRSLEKCDRLLKSKSDDETDNSPISNLQKYCHFKTSNIHYNMVRDLMNNRKKQYSLLNKKNLEVPIDEKLICKEFLYAGDIIEFRDIALFSNIVYATVLSTSYNIDTSQKSITTTFACSIECNHIIRRIKTTTMNNTLIDVDENHGQYIALELYSFLNGKHEMDLNSRPPTDGMVLQHTQDMSNLYEQKKVIKEVPSDINKNIVKEGNHQN